MRSVSVQRWPLTLGRALDNDIVIDDVHVAAHHASLQPGSSGQMLLTLGASLNGALVGQQRVSAPAEIPLPADATWQMGATRLRLRLPGDTLADEKPLPTLAGMQRVAPVLAGVMLLLFSLGEHWINLDPGADATRWLPAAMGLPIGLAAWCGAWALVSKLFQHRFDFMGHLRIVLPWVLGIELLDAIVTPLAAGLAWPWLWRAVGPLQALLGLLMLRAHLVQVLPHSARMVSAALASAAVVAAGISLTLTQRSTDRFSKPAYMSTLPLPALQWASATPAQTLVQDLAPVAEKLAQRVKKARDEDNNDSEPASD